MLVTMQGKVSLYIVSWFDTRLGPDAKFCILPENAQLLPEVEWKTATSSSVNMSLDITNKQIDENL